MKILKDTYGELVVSMTTQEIRQFTNYNVDINEGKEFDFKEAIKPLYEKLEARIAEYSKLIEKHGETTELLLRGFDSLRLLRPAQREVLEWYLTRLQVCGEATAEGEDARVELAQDYGRKLEGIL